MKYFSITTIAKAYQGFQNCMTNKSWGYLSILRGCKSSIHPLIPYEVNMDDVSNFLENIFNFSQTKKKYEGGRSLFVVFSNKWDQYFKYEGKFSPNIFDVIAWAYRRTAFPDDISKGELVNRFCREFNFSANLINDCFDINDKDLTFSNVLYIEADLKNELKKIGVSFSSENIDAKKTSVVASPGEISRGPFIQTLYAGLDITDYVLILQSDYNSLYRNQKIENETNGSESLQQIFYGAPGTGKSHRIEEDTEGKSVIRTTFHPDTDYSTFVGAYKPIMESTDMKVIPVVVKNGISLNQNEGTYTEKRITYKFVKQAFLKAYLGAWKKMTANPSNPEPQFLIIEEINRGNCAQIFGDLFQLLDRGDKGYSAYTIEADTDMQQAIADAFKDEKEYKLDGANINAEEADIKYTSNYGKTLSEDIQEGRVLLLPKNLYIWATMNTSDQSLFPIDSAFKRRWEWVYMPIKDHKDKNYKIEIDGTTYDWWGFLEKINSVINTVTSSEDKKLGYFFVKTDKNIDAKQFVGKVLFYLWNDVFKNYGFDNPIFDKEDKNKFAFSEFFQKDGSPETGNIKKFLKNLDETIDKDHPFTEAKAASDTSATENNSQDLFANQ